MIAASVSQSVCADNRVLLLHQVSHETTLSLDSRDKDESSWAASRDQLILCMIYNST